MLVIKIILFRLNYNLFMLMNIVVKFYYLNIIISRVVFLTGRLKKKKKLQKTIQTFLK